MKKLTRPFWVWIYWGVAVAFFLIEFIVPLLDHPKMFVIWFAGFMTACYVGYRGLKYIDDMITAEKAKKPSKNTA